MKEVVVIGAGPSGLASIRSLIKYKDKVNITAYEVSDRVGGLWVNRDPYKMTAMYDNMRTNLPKEIGGFLDFPFASSIEKSFLPHAQILEYMESFANHFSMHQYIKFRHRVLEVDPFTTENGAERWYVTVRNEETGAMTTKQFDAVMVCNGHYSKAYVPSLEGMKTFPGEIIHSMYYQTPEYYADKTVLIVGGGISGGDLLLDIHTSARKIFFSHDSQYFTKTPLPENCEWVPRIARIDGSKIVLVNRRIVQADIILLTTGYRFDFPFLSERCRPEVKDNHVANIYRLMIDIKHPSLYYIGLNKNSVMFPQFSMQAELAVAFITEKTPAVSQEEMQAEYEERYQQLVMDKNLPPNHFHKIAGYQFEYADTLRTQSRSDYGVYPIIRKLVTRMITNFLTNIIFVKDCVYKAVSKEDFEVIYEPPVYADINRSNLVGMPTSSTS